jgi:hypothetical protein
MVPKGGDPAMGFEDDKTHKSFGRDEERGEMVQGGGVGWSKDFQRHEPKMIAFKLQNF